MLKGDPLGGAHAFYSGSFREWWEPVRPGMRITRRNALVGVHDKRSEFAERAVHEWTGEVFATHDPSSVLCAQYRLMIRTERTKAEARGKYDETVIEPYTDEQLAAIDAQYASEPELRRGAEPRCWEDVEEGDEVGPIVKGPMRVTDMVCWHSGMGMGLYGVKALRLGYQQRQRVPRFFRPDDLNVPDVQQRVHWDAEWARRAGNPAIYDYGRMRETWLVHLCTDWMGDDAWLWKLDCQFRRFNYVGDTHWMRGRRRAQVPRRRRPPRGRPRDARARTSAARSRHPGTRRSCCRVAARGAVELPEPPGGARTAQEALDALVERFAAMEDS